MIFRRLASSLSANRLPPTIRQILSVPDLPVAPIAIQGWVKFVRHQKRHAFAVITDGSSQKGIQAVFTDPQQAKGLTNGSCVHLEGSLTESPGPKQDRELRVSDVQILANCDPETYPIQKQSLTVDYLRDQFHLRTRADGPAATLRLRDTIQRSLHRYFEDRGFCYVHTPIITSNDCEGAGEAFRLAPVQIPTSPQPEEFFGQPSYLTVSSQLHLEALAGSISRVYTIAPAFRAERSATSRHLAEFWMLEAEWAFINDLEDVMFVVEEAIRTVYQAVEGSDDMGVLWKDKGGLSGSDRRKALECAMQEGQMWPRITYTEAVGELRKYHESKSAQHFEFAPVWGQSLKSEHERYLSEHLFGSPVFVTDYPADVKPFYMRRREAGGPVVACFDLLVPYTGELVGGSLREERLEMLEASMGSNNMTKRDYRWYLDGRRFGGAPHGGFGIGFERLVAWLGGIDNVRECVAMPRWVGRMLG